MRIPTGTGKARVIPRYPPVQDDTNDTWTNSVCKKILFVLFLLLLLFIRLMSSDLFKMDFNL